MKRKSFYESETESVKAKLQRIIFNGLDKDRKVVCNALNKIFTRQLQSCLAGSSDFSQVWDYLTDGWQSTVYRDPYGCRHYGTQEIFSRRSNDYFAFTASADHTTPAYEFLIALNLGASKAFAENGHKAVVRYVPITDYERILVHNAMVSVFVSESCVDDDGDGDYKQIRIVTVPDFVKIVESAYPLVASHIGDPEQLAMDVDVIAKLLKQYTTISLKDEIDFLKQILEDSSIQNQCLSALEKRSTVEVSKMYTDWEDAWASDGSYYVALFNKACAKLKLTCEVEDSMDFYSIKSDKYYGSLDWELVCEFMDGLVAELKAKKIKVPEFVESVIGFIQSESYYDEDRFGSEDDWEDDEESED